MNFGFSGEMIFLFFLALILFGPKKLPEMGRQIGRLMNEFRRASNEFRSQIESEINAAGVDVKPQLLPPLKEPLGAIASRIFNPPAGAEAPKSQAPTTSSSNAGSSNASAPDRSAGDSPAVTDASRVRTSDPEPVAASSSQSSPSKVAPDA
ncbi:MAG TPA: twin-arginine translocase TatA/TatE family subunit [Terriglobales bacterium]|nr:twin-arginine translocase TatA/TatE family subunit [Terriglobales bacterium]